MAQQTQINTLLPYFTRFIEAFPNIEVLANTKEEDVLKHWEGLGYYSRARNIHKSAKLLKNKEFPDKYKEILKLPGIGPYTAGAIASICFNEKVPAIDGNVIRVISRIYTVKEDLNQTKLKNQLWTELKDSMPEQAGPYNESLMELGALICTPKKPKCLICPVRAYCKAYEEDCVQQLPVKKVKPKKEIEHNEALIIINEKGKPLFIKREENQLLGSLDGFPLFIQENKSGSKIKDYIKDLDVTDLKFLGSSKHTFTHKQWITDVYSVKTKQDLPDFSDSPASVPTAFKKMLKLLD